MKKTKKVKTQKVLAFDLGGTKVHVGVVDENGRILCERREAIFAERGKTAVINQLASLGNDYLKQFSEIRHVGLASAGPLDPSRGLLLDPTNISNPLEKKKSWGKVHITQILSKKLNRSVTLENDAAAAMLAEHWKGKARGYSNAMILTLGTGLGTGIMCNGKLLRSGRGLHPEAGHIIIKAGDPSAPCGCGNLGCAEAYLSGLSFTRRQRHRFDQKNIQAKDIADMARLGDSQALLAFKEYAELMAIAITNYVVCYSPEIIIFTGSFAEAADLFIPQTKEHLKDLLKRRRVGVDLLPKLAVSALENKAGLLGGAYVALSALQKKKFIALSQN